MSSWRKKMRVNWKRSIDEPSNNAADGSEETTDLLESQLKSSPLEAKRECVKKTGFFRSRRSYSKEKHSSSVAASVNVCRGSNKGALWRMLRKRKDKKAESRSTWDTVQCDTTAHAQELFQGSSARDNSCETAEAKHREVELIMTAHAPTCSLEPAPIGSECMYERDGILEVVNCCDLKKEATRDHFRFPEESLKAPSLLLKSTCQTVLKNENRLGLSVNGSAVCGGVDLASGDCGPPSLQCVQDYSSLTNGTKSNEMKGHFSHPDPQHDLPHCICEQSQGENPCKEHSAESVHSPASVASSALCRDWEQKSEKLNEAKGKDFIIVEQQSAKKNQDAPMICVIWDDMTQSVDCKAFVQGDEETLGATRDSFTEEASWMPPLSKKSSGAAVHLWARADSQLSAETDMATPACDANDETVHRDCKLEASEGYFQDNVYYLNAISAEQESQNKMQAVDGLLNKLSRASKVSTVATLPRHLTTKPTNEKRTPQCSGPGAVAEASSGASKALKPRAEGQVRRSGSFVCDECKLPVDAQSGLSLRAPGAADVDHKSCTKGMKQHQQVAGKEKASGPPADQMPMQISTVCPAIFVLSEVGRDSTKNVTASAVEASTQVPVVDSTDHKLPSDSDDNESLISLSCNVSDRTGAAARLSCPGAGASPPGNTGEEIVQLETTDEFLNQIERLGARYSSLTNEVNRVNLQLKHVSTGFAAFGVIIKRLNEWSNSFSRPTLSELRECEEELEQACIALEEYIEQLKLDQDNEMDALKLELEAQHAKDIAELEVAHKHELAGYFESHALQLENMNSFYTGKIKDGHTNHAETLDSLNWRHREIINAVTEDYSLRLNLIKENHHARRKEIDEDGKNLLMLYKALVQKISEFRTGAYLDSDAKVQQLRKENANLHKEVQSLLLVLEKRAEEVQRMQQNYLDMKRKEENELDECETSMESIEARIQYLYGLLNEQSNLQNRSSVENDNLRDTPENQRGRESRLDMHIKRTKCKPCKQSSSAISYAVSQLRCHSSPPDPNYAVAETTAIPQSGHASEPPRAGNSGGSVPDRTHGSHRSSQRSRSLPSVRRADFHTGICRSISETSLPQDGSVQQLSPSFTALSGPFAQRTQSGLKGPFVSI